MTKLDPKLGLVLMWWLMSRAKRGFTNLDPNRFYPSARWVPPPAPPPHAGVWLVHQHDAKD